MALSKEEQSVLDDIEKGLREDPDFPVVLDLGRVKRSRRLRTIAMAAPGLLLLLLGEMLALTTVIAGDAVSLCGFLVMLLALARTATRSDSRWSLLR